MVLPGNSLYTYKKPNIMKPHKPYPRSRLKKLLEIAQKMQEKRQQGNELNIWNLYQLTKKRSN